MLSKRMQTTSPCLTRSQRIEGLLLAIACLNSVVTRGDPVLKYRVSEYLALVS